jgi:hypothetical protein
MGVVVRVQKTPEVTKRTPALELLAELCYFYPQYTLAAARRLPAKHVYLLLRVATKLKSAEYYNLTQIAAAPHTKEGRGVKTLSEEFKNKIDQEK